MKENNFKTPKINKIEVHLNPCYKSLTFTISKHYKRVFMSTSKSKNLIHSIWNFLGSVKLTIALLVILALVSVLGTLIPQQIDPLEFQGKIHPRLFYLIYSLDMFDLYHSLWFKFIIASLALNLIVCSIIRFPGTWKRFSTVPRPDREKPFESLPPEHSFIVNKNLDDTASATEIFLKTHCKNLIKKKSKEQCFFYCEKGRYSNFGVYLVHLSVLVIIIGGLLGAFFGFEAYVTIPEGKTVNSVTLIKGGIPLALGFEIRCDEFNVSFYDNGTPKEFRSELTFLSERKDVEKKTLLVNHPVNYKGIKFYQASYGAASIKKIHLKIKENGSENKAAIIEAEQGNPELLPQGEGQFMISEIKDNFMNMLGPAVKISIRPKNGPEKDFWIFRNYESISKRFPKLIESSPRLNPSSFKPYVFSLEGFDYNYYTGLQVNKDPGVSIVWAGCFLMVCGFFVTFYSSHRRIWVRISIEKTGLEVKVAGTSSKNPVGLKRNIENIINGLKTILA